MAYNDKTSLDRAKPILLIALAISTVGLWLIGSQFAFSDNQSFNPAENLSKSPGHSLFPKVALSGDKIYTVWSDNSSGNLEIFFARSTDGGANYSSPSNLSNDADQSRAPSIIISNSNIFVVWSSGSGNNSEIFFARSTDGGASFSIANISQNSGFSYTPQLVASGSNVYVVWNDNTDGNLDIMFARSTDGGASFSASVTLNDNTGGQSSIPSIAVFSSNLYVVWNDNTDGNLDIMFARSSDGGYSFNSPTNISVNPGGSYSPQLAVSGSNVFILWNDNTDGNLDVMIAKSIDDGATFTGALDLSDPLGLNGAYADYPQIALYNSNVYVIWQGSSQAEVSMYTDTLDIYMAASTDEGNNFNMPLNLSNTAGQSSLPRIAASSNGVYAIWHENVGNNYEILTTNNHLPTYIFSGILQPINSDGSSIFKLGSTVPIKFQLLDASGNNVDTAEAQLHIAKVTNYVVGDQTEGISSGSANSGNLFRYDAGTHQYSYNLATKNLSKGTWQMIIELDDGSVHNGIISLR
jgi:hypothetical protein